MSQTITITVPDHVLQPLERVAKATQQPLESFSEFAVNAFPHKPNSIPSLFPASLRLQADSQSIQPRFPTKRHSTFLFPQSQMC